MGSDRPVEQTETMPKVDVLKDSKRLTFTDIVYMKRVEKKNWNRAIAVQNYRKRNRISGIALGLGVIGIYAYTMYSVKQEKFLDDFEVPQKTIKKAA